MSDKKINSTESEFLKLQKVSCEPEPEPFSPPDRPCPTCIPDPSYVEPEWWSTSDPYLNKRLCSYQVRVDMNSHGETFRVSEIENNKYGSFDTLKKTYIRAGIRKMLRHFDKIETDKIVCATVGVEMITEEYEVRVKKKKEPTTVAELQDQQNQDATQGLGGPDLGIPDAMQNAANTFSGQQQTNQQTQPQEYEYETETRTRTRRGGMECQDIYTLDTEQYVTSTTHISSLQANEAYETQEIDEMVSYAFPEIQNLEALELFAKVDDYHFHGFSDNIMSVLVSIPAYKFDQVPDAPSLPEPDTDVEELVIKRKDLRSAIDKVSAIIPKFSQYQSYFRKFQNGNLYIEQKAGDNSPTTIKKFYLKWQQEGLSDFQDALEVLLEKNGFEYYDFLGINFRGELADEIRITFDKSDEKKPFRVKSVEAKFKGCPWKKCTKGFVDSFLQKPVVRRGTTIMGYVAQIEKMSQDLEARETPAWLDYVVQYTFPKLSINYGSSLEMSNKTAVNCLGDMLGLDNLEDAILDEVMSFSKAFAFQMNQNNCKILTNTGSAPPVLDRGSPGNPIRVGTAQAFTELWKQGKKDQKKKKDKKETSLKKSLKDLNKKVNGTDGGTSKLKNVLAVMNPCDWKAISLEAIRCLMAGMTLNDAYKAVIKKTLGTLSNEALEVFMSGLPADKQQKIRDKVKEEFGNMPMPWETGYKAGSLDNVVDRKTADKVSSEVQAAKGKLESKASIEQQIKTFNDVIKTKKECIADPIKCYEDKFKEDTKKKEELEFELQKYMSDMDTLPGLMEKAKILPTPETDLPSGTYKPRQTMREPVKKIQLALIELGFMSEEQYNTGPGFYGPRTTAAIEAVQSASNYEGRDLEQITQDGHYGSNTKKKMEDMYAAKSATSATAGDPSSYGALYNELYSDLQKAQGYSLTISNQIGEINRRLEKGSTDIVADVYTEIAKIEEELIKLNKKLSTADKAVHETGPYQVWDQVPDKIKEQIVEQEREKIDKKRLLTGLTPKDKIEQGTFGTALGNVQEVFVGAFIEAAMETADIQEMLAAIDRLPGSKIVGAFIASFKCPSSPLIYPPLDSFLKTLTFDPCGPGKTKMALPSMQDYKFPSMSGWDWIDSISAAFEKALKASVKNVILALIKKMASIVEGAGCKALSTAGQFAGAVVTGNPPTKDGGWKDIIDGAFCGADKYGSDQSKLDELNSNIMKNAGATAASGHAALADTLSRLGTGVEYKNAMLGNANPALMRELSRAIGLMHPEFADSLGDPDQMEQFFLNAGNLLTDVQRAALAAGIDDDDIYPIDSSICLTKAEKDQWDKERREALNAPDDVAKEFVNRLNDRAKNDLGSLIDSILKGPDGMLEDALAKALSTDDPACEKKNSIVKLNHPEIKKAMSEIDDGLFKRLQKAYLDDMLEQNIFEFWDSPGILSLILSDKANYTMNFHYAIRRNILWKFIYWATYTLFPRYEDNPETVGIVLYNYMQENDILTTEDGLDQGTALLPCEIPSGESTWESKLLYNDFYMKSGKYNNDFGYRIYQSSPGQTHDIFVSLPLDSSLSEHMEEIGFPTDSEITVDGKGVNRYKNHVVRNLFQSIFNKNKIENVDIDLSKVNDFMENVNKWMFNDLRKLLLIGKDGGPSQGFLHGDNNTEITYDDMVYVGPNGEPYDYEESERVLGRSKTNNSRVEFLDPARYGGEYNSPQIYIHPAKNHGWANLAKMFIPSVEMCQPRSSNFLFIDTIKERMDKLRNEIKPHKKLEFSPDCVQEIPFDKIGSPNTMATLEGVIRATIRVYLSDFLIRSIPVSSNIRLNLDDNYDNSLVEYIASLMKKGIKDQYSWWASTYEGYVYWLLFLEQVAQTVNRMVKSGELETNAEIASVMTTINEAQKAHIVPTRASIALAALEAAVEINAGPYVDDLTPDSDESEQLLQSMIAGSAIAAYGDKWKDNLNGFGSFGFAWSLFSVNSARFSTKLHTIAKVEEQCSLLLKYVIKQELENYREVFETQMSPMPFVHDLTKYVIGAGGKISGFAYGETPKSGIVDTEVTPGPTTPINPAKYGTCNDCTVDLNKHPLDGIELSQEQINVMKKRGGVYIEKYLRIVDVNDPLPPIPPKPKTPPDDPDAPSSNKVAAENKVLQAQLKKEGFTGNLPILKQPLVPNTKAFSKVSKVSPPPPPDFVTNRDFTLKGVVNIKHFGKWLNGLYNNGQLPETVNISDWFGNAVMNKEKTSYRGSTGIKFGTRIMFIPPEGMIDADVPLEVKQREKCFSQTPAYIAKPEDDGLGAQMADLFKSMFGERPQEKPPSDKERLQITGQAFPIAYHEQDISDIKLFKLATNEFYEKEVEGLGYFGEELKCYIDKMCIKPEFEIFFKQAINVRKVTSMMMMYSYDNFLPSLGQGEDERESPLFSDDDQESPAMDTAMGDAFNDSREECRKLFVSTYKRNGFDPPSEEDEETSILDDTREILANTLDFTMFSDWVPFWLKWKIRPDKPTDKEEAPCGNNFSKLFKKK